MNLAVDPCVQAEEGDLQERAIQTAVELGMQRRSDFLACELQVTNPYYV